MTYAISRDIRYRKKGSNIRPQGGSWSAAHMPSVSWSSTFAFRSSEVRGQASLVRVGPLWGHWPIGYVSLFLKRTADVLAPRFLFFCHLFVWVVSRLAGHRPMSPQFRKVHRPLLLRNYQPISIWSELSKVFERIVSVCSERFMEPQLCASNHPVCLSEMSGYLWCVFMYVPFTAKCIWEWARG